MMLPTVCLALLGATAAAERIHVSPGGNDAWSGRLPAPDAAGTDGPLATPARARAAVRERRRQGVTGPLEVVLGPGTYHLREPLVFRPEDSGTAAGPTTWRAAEGARAVLSGGRPITGWRSEAGRQVVDLPEAGDGRLDFRLLRIGDHWAIRARHPNFNPAEPRTGGWAFAQYAGEPWEKGAFGVGVSNIHNVGDKLTWKVTVPAAGSYEVWLRYGHKMKDYGIAEMGGRTAIGVDDQPLVPLEDLPDTGNWAASRWARTARLSLPAGEHLLRWQNLQGGGLNLDALALCTDPAWDPNEAVGDFTWWGGYRFTQPRAGEHHLLIQAEACSSYEGPEIQVGTGTPAGTRSHLSFAPGALPAIAEPEGAEVHIFIAWGWVNAIVPVARLDAPRGLIEFQGEAAQDVRIGNRFFLENARELLDAPGEWFLDRKAGQLLYLPERPDFAGEEAVAPILDHLIRIEGEPAEERWVEHLHFKDLAFTDTSYTLTRDYYTPSDGAVRVGGARRVSLSGCEFAWLGGYGVHLEQQSHDIEIARCHFHDLGQGGVHLVGGTADQPHHCRILGNTIERIGLIYKHVAGVYLTHGSDNRIAHNRITDTPRYGISLKSQGEERLSHRNLVEYNELLRTNLETNDTGAIETLGYEHRDSGNVIRFNRIFDSVGLLTRPDGTIVTPHFTWGVYLDDYSSGTTVYGNIIARTQLGGVCIHGGQNNVIENNILIDGHEHQVRLQPRDAFMRGNRFERNIVVWRRPTSQLVFSYNDRRDVVSGWDHNLYWLEGADLTALTHKLTPLGPWAAWREAGFDAHSVIADPRFVDRDRDDYRLHPDSPALALGFQPIPVEKIGPDGLD